MLALVPGDGGEGESHPAAWWLRGEHNTQGGVIGVDGGHQFPRGPLPPMSKRRCPEHSPNDCKGLIKKGLSEGGQQQGRVQDHRVTPMAIPGVAPPHPDCMGDSTGPMSIEGPEVGSGVWT